MTYKCYFQFPDTEGRFCIEVEARYNYIDQVAETLALKLGAEYLYKDEVEANFPLDSRIEKRIITTYIDRRTEMDTRFTDFTPQTCKRPEFGPEPCLADIILHYYKSHGIEHEKACKHTEDYIREWVKIEEL